MFQFAKKRDGPINSHTSADSGFEENGNDGGHLRSSNAPNGTRVARHVSFNLDTVDDVTVTPLKQQTQQQQQQRAAPATRQPNSFSPLQQVNHDFSPRAIPFIATAHEGRAQVRTLLRGGASFTEHLGLSQFTSHRVSAFRVGVARVRKEVGGTGRRVRDLNYLIATNDEQTASAQRITDAASGLMNS